jgi:hypothetical protein
MFCAVYPGEPDRYKDIFAGDELFSYQHTDLIAFTADPGLTCESTWRFHLAACQLTQLRRAELEANCRSLCVLNRVSWANRNAELQ